MIQDEEETDEDNDEVEADYDGVLHMVCLFNLFLCKIALVRC